MECAVHQDVPPQMSSTNEVDVESVGIKDGRHCCRMTCGLMAASTRRP
jgi:hypothetical protein